jgi:trehalose synthase
MVEVELVETPRRPIARLLDVIGLARTTRVLDEASEFRKRIGSRVIWNFSSTAAGGGVAEMLQSIVGYTKDLGVDIRWYIVHGDGEFFRITKRVHNRIHGAAGDGGELGESERSHVDEILAANAASMGDQINHGDLVLLHDPQTAGLAGHLSRRGAHVVWRSHIGIDRPTDLSRSGWDFLRPFLADAEAFVFTKSSYAPDFLPPSRLWTIPPSIDPFSAKNQALEPAIVEAILVSTGLLSKSTTAGDPTAAPPTYTRRDGSPGIAEQRATVLAEELPGPLDPLVVQVSRWDRLKDMAGVMQGFADRVAPFRTGRLVLAGPSVEGVADDPEGAMVFAECAAQWHGLPTSVRSRIVLATLPMGDVDDNAAIVNALQRRASVIVQKSLAEGFGLTVAEGMWKGRPVIGSAVGGITDQIGTGAGVLLDDPTDLNAFGDALRQLLDDPELAEQLGLAAHAYVTENFVGDVHLLRYAELFTSVLSQVVSREPA